jgi:hypothetical protein
VPPIHDLIREVDRRWSWSAGKKINLRIIGASALMLQARYERGTKDSDILETADLGEETKARLLELAGPGKEVSKRHGLYIEFVASGLPLLPQAPEWLDLADLNGELVHFHIQVLSVVDVVVSKLKRLHGNDLRDIEAMIDLGLVPEAVLIERFRSAVDSFLLDARAEDLPKYVENLHRVERDLFGSPETEIDLPDWLRA